MSKAPLSSDERSLSSVPTRSGERPATTKSGPHAQITERSSPAIWGELVARAFSIDGISQGHSSVSMPDSMAGLLLNLPENHGERSLAVKGRVEPFHIHGVSDTSIHAVLPSDRAREICESGWGEPHTYADFPTQIMIYAPRDLSELEIVIGILKESVLFAQANQ